MLFRMIGAGAERFSPFCGNGERAFSVPLGCIIRFFTVLLQSPMGWVYVSCLAFLFYKNLNEKCNRLRCFL